ncbi:tripartite tricarboxylate transporter substrate binding protein [Hydrogenophaga sp. 2FB]|uniref:Bug family tripartite tricarboxylate transporter substrate binding protein n=1 Tax=Hydrogenophaga sp. 2FB TaxID=2502187 RepID=UPI0010F7A447|nr:tripartite tricarboxylate transporter substrate binding protein [Hydrogenophaga sp. 2FB]
MKSEVASPLTRRALCTRLAAWGTLAAMPPALWAQPAYSSRVVKLVIPTAPGGSVDSIGRFLAESLTRPLGTTVIVENRAGAGGTIGIQSVVKSPPDGLTLVLGIAATMSVQPAVNTLPYNPVKDLAPVAVFAQGGLVIAVPAASPAQNVKDLRALAAKKGELAFGSGGQATFGHLTGELLKSELAVPMRHIPYRGAAPAVTDLMAGLLDLAVVDAFSAAPHVQSGKIRILAIAGPNRHNSFPQVPTLSESGVPFTRGTWIGLFAPAGVPQDMLDRLTGDIKNLSAQPEFRAQVQHLGFTPLFMPPTDVSRMLAQEIEEWKRTAKTANLKID